VTLGIGPALAAAGFTAWAIGRIAQLLAMISRMMTKLLRLCAKAAEVMGRSGESFRRAGTSMRKVASGYSQKAHDQFRFGIKYDPKSQLPGYQDMGDGLRKASDTFDKADSWVFKPIDQAQENRDEGMSPPSP